MYAIIECGGKQHRVQEGDLIRVEKLAVEVGSDYTIDKVLMVGGDSTTLVGTPYVPGYVVTGKVLNHDKDKKVLVFHYKAKKNIRVKNGHRQPFTSLLIEKIFKGGKVEPVQTKAEKPVVKTAPVEAEPEKKETKAKAVVKAAPAETEVKEVKAAKTTGTAKAKVVSTETAAKTVKTAKPKAETTKTASVAKPAAAKAVKTAKAETAAATTKTTKAKSVKTEKTEA